MNRRPVLCSLSAVSVVNTVITHRVRYAEERERIVGAFSRVMDVPGCRGEICAFRELKQKNAISPAIIMINRVIFA